jgi:hypothetical protein
MCGMCRGQQRAQLLGRCSRPEGPMRPARSTASLVPHPDSPTTGRPHGRHKARLPRPVLNVVAVRPGRDDLPVPQRNGPASRFMCVGILRRWGPHVAADLVRAQSERWSWSRGGYLGRPGICHLDGMGVTAIENDQLRSAQLRSPHEPTAGGTGTIDLIATPPRGGATTALMITMVRTATASATIPAALRSTMPTVLIGGIGRRDPYQSYRAVARLCSILGPRYRERRSASVNTLPPYTAAHPRVACRNVRAPPSRPWLG